MKNRFNVTYAAGVIKSKIFASKVNLFLFLCILCYLVSEILSLFSVKDFYVALAIIGIVGGINFWLRFGLQIWVGTEGIMPYISLVIVCHFFPESNSSLLCLIARIIGCAYGIAYGYILFEFFLIIEEMKRRKGHLFVPESIPDEDSDMPVKDVCVFVGVALFTVGIFLYSMFPLVRLIFSLL